MNVNTLAVHLPELNNGIPDWIAAFIQDPAFYVGDFTDRRGDAFINNQQVVVCIQWQFIRVEGAFCLVWGKG